MEEVEVYQDLYLNGNNYKAVKQEPLATDKQEGGNHYKTAIQPIEYIHANNLDFFEGNVVKYVTRHKKKNGAEDIRKAIHYLEMILQYHYPKETK